MMKEKMKEMRTPYWHEESWNDFINKTLPGLLGSLVRLSAYKVEKSGPYRMTVSCGTETSISYRDILCPDSQGRFHLDGRFLTVVPELDKEDPRKIKCCGELALDYIASRLGTSPAGGLETAEAFETWLPLNRLVNDFFHLKGQIIDERNWLAVHTHLNRVKYDGPGLIWHESFPGRLDPVECPEGPNMGRVYTLAAGADVKEGRIIPNHGAPRDDLGCASRMIPFLEHDDAARALMGANMMRQWVEPENGEKPLVFTGLEPEGFPLLGFNLLTAYVSLGADTFEDGLVLSRSAAERMGYADPILPGDKFSNRHGQKGVVSAIWEDEKMPRLPDGRPIELAVSFIGLHTRLNFGQILEGAAGLSARHTGKPFRAEPFSTPGPEAVAASPLPDFCNDEGMVKLTFPGGEGEAWSTAGYVYWGLTVHRGASKLMGPSDISQRLGRMEYAALLESGAFRTARDFATKANGDELSFKRLKAALAQGEIDLDLTEKGARIRFAPVPGDTVNTAPLCSHPWSGARGLYSLPDEGELGFLEEKLSSPDLFPALRSQLEERLEREVKEYFSNLLDPFMVSPGNRITRSARAVIAPGEAGRGVNELGIPRSLWEEFGLKEGEPLLINRAPTFRASSVLALMPYPLEEPVIRMHPLLCYWMNADFDGDQAALYQPVGEEIREEVRQTLTPAAHLIRDPSLVSSLLPRQESLLGLYLLEKEIDGREKINRILGYELPAGASLKKQLEETYSLILREEGGETLISRAGQLFCLGLDRAACRGHSMSPLIGEGGEERMKADLTEFIEGGTDEECRSFLPQRDGVLSGARGTCRQLGQLLGPIGSAVLPEGKEFPVKGNRYSGLDGDAFHKMAAGMRQGLLVLSRDYEEGSFRFMSEYNLNMDYNPKGHSFLARAMRSENPGRVFAHAAANGEIDPLTDPWAAVFCGEIPR